MPGIPVVISTNGLGTPVKSVTSGGPVMTVATNGLGMPIVLSDRGSPFVVEDGSGATLAYFARNGSTQPWYSGATGPNAVYEPVGNRTYITWQVYDVLTASRFCWIRAYNHSIGQWEKAVSVGARGAFLDNDDHGVPSVCITSDGYIAVFWGGHNQDCMMAISRSVRSISGGWREYTITGKYTYWRPVPRSDGGIDLFVRWRDDQISGRPVGVYTLRYRKVSIAAGVATIAADVLVADMGDDSRWYSGDTIRGSDGLVWMIATRADYEDVSRKNVYFAKFNPDAQTITKLAGGAPLAWPVLNFHQTGFDIYQHSASSTVTGNIPAMAFDAAGRMHVSFNIGATAGSGGTGNLSQQDLMHMVVTGTTIGTPVKIGELDQRYESGRLAPLAGGAVGVYYPSKEALRGGNIMRRVIPSGLDGAGALPEETIMAYTPGRDPLNEVSTVTVPAHPNFRVAFGECADSASNSVARGHRLYAHGDQGLLRGDPDTVPLSLPTGALTVLDFTDPTTLSANTDGTGVVAVDTNPVGRITDLSGNGLHASWTGANQKPVFFDKNYRGSVRNQNLSLTNSAIQIPSIDLIKTDGFSITISVAPSNLSAEGTIVALDDGSGGALRQILIAYNIVNRTLKVVPFQGTLATAQETPAGSWQPTTPSVITFWGKGAAGWNARVDGQDVLSGPENINVGVNQLFFGAQNGSFGSKLAAEYLRFVARSGAVTLGQIQSDEAWARDRLF